MRVRRRTSAAAGLAAFDGQGLRLRRLVHIQHPCPLRASAGAPSRRFAALYWRRALGSRPRLKPRFSLVVYVALAILAFSSVITTSFVGDDWDFLTLVVHAPGIRVCFVPLVGRFVRPLVMLTYYANYKAFGLWPV